MLDEHAGKETWGALSPLFRGKWYTMAAQLLKAERRSGTILAVGGFRYTYHRTNGAGDYAWRCSRRRDCTAKVSLSISRFNFRISPKSELALFGGVPGLG